MTIVLSVCLCHSQIRQYPEPKLMISRSLPFVRTEARFTEVPKLFGHISGDIILFVSSKRRRLEARNFTVISISIPLQHMKRPALKNKRVGVLQMAFRAGMVTHQNHCSPLVMKYRSLTCF